MKEKSIQNNLSTSSNHKLAIISFFRNTLIWSVYAFHLQCRGTCVKIRFYWERKPSFNELWKLNLIVETRCHADDYVINAINIFLFKEEGKKKARNKANHLNRNYLIFGFCFDFSFFRVLCQIFLLTFNVFYEQCQVKLEISE